MRRILVITKFRYLGDTIVATPLLRDIAKGIADAEITVLGGPSIPALLQGCPGGRCVILERAVRAARDADARAADMIFGGDARRADGGGARRSAPRARRR